MTSLVCSRTLLSLPAARLLRSRHGNSTLSGDLAFFFSQLCSHAVDFQSTIPLLTQVIEPAPDSTIWNAVFVLVANQPPHLSTVSNLNLIHRSNPLLPHSRVLSRLTLRSITAFFKRSTSAFTKTRRAFTRSTMRAGHGRLPLHALLKMPIHKYVMAAGQIIHIRQLKPLSLNGFGSFCQPSLWKDAAHITPLQQTTRRFRRHPSTRSLSCSFEYREV